MTATEMMTTVKNVSIEMSQYKKLGYINYITVQSVIITINYNNCLLYYQFNKHYNYFKKHLQRIILLISKLLHDLVNKIVGTSFELVNQLLHMLLHTDESFF